MNDETLLKTVKNSLMIAGHEMGPVGDHWPAVNAVIRGVDKEFVQYERDQAVLGELEFHIASAIRQVEEAAEKVSEDKKKEMLSFAENMWQRYYAIFEPVDSAHEPSPEDLLGDDVSCIKNIRAAQNIIRGLGGRA
jgi:hypothetical protein